MSLINDALKQARKPPPEGVPSSLAPLQPVAGETSPTPVWLLPAIGVLLVVVAVSLTGWMVTHHGAHTVVAAVEPAAQRVAAAQEGTAIVATPQAATVATVAPPVPAPIPAPVQPAKADTTNFVNPPPPPAKPAVPRLQGITYLPGAVSAIVDGKTVHPGDRFREYRVKTISRNSVALIGPDQKELLLDMEN